MKEEKIIARVFPYNHEYENTKNLEIFLNYLNNDIKKQYTDSRTIIARYNKKELPEGTYILFLYDKKIRGYGILESQKKDNKTKKEDNVNIWYKKDSIVVLNNAINLDELEKNFNYKHSNQYGANFLTTKDKLETFLKENDLEQNIDKILDDQPILKNFDDWNIDSPFPNGEYPKKSPVGKETKSSGTIYTGIKKIKKGRIGEKTFLEFLRYKSFQEKKDFFDVANEKKTSWDITIKNNNREMGIEVKNLTNSYSFYLSQNQVECLKKAETKLLFVDIENKCFWISKKYNSLMCLPKVIEDMNNIIDNCYREYRGLFEVLEIKININTNDKCWENDFIKINSNNTKNDIIKIIFDK